MIDPREFIRTKRNRQTHAPDAIREFVAAYLRKEVHDYQVSAWLMAAFLNGLDGAETDALTHALLHSGRVFDWSSLGRPSADKHSTGGVGDKISLMLAPVVAACGVLVPMVSGRGLGHTGGTLDKLEAIPGFRTTLPPEQMRDQLDRLGIVMVGQGPDLAPADGLFYSLRDVTSTVEFEPFIVSSIVSKKIAEGARALAYDVKCGSGAFMKTPEQARSLAKRLVATSRALGANAAALITDMNWPLGGAVGNALEVREACETLHGEGPADTRELTVELSALMLRLAGAVPDDDAGRVRAARALDDGSAWEVFLRMVEAQGGDPKSLEHATNLHPAPVVSMVPAERDGVVSGCDCFALGELIVSMGGGRRAKEDAIDPRVGLVVLRQPGDAVKKGEPLAELHLAAPDLGIVERASECFSIADAASPRGTTLLERVE
ncbi:MAG: thymidine phosphorylase [Candidatus Eisenbacteria bacterium]|uniref:Thymidine phosphorylase n=1 Tax=Eiseniibacteriota bacterium TaxID=2212470 RepID=A0A933SF39_UNCEI|nr:thymidine phosphorylase [Candidatus Eisenbacteria bacterium]